MDPAESAARARLGRFGERLARTSIDEIRLLGAVPLDPAAHHAARAAAEEAARAAGVGELAVSAQADMRAWATRLLNPSMYEPSFDGAPWRRETLDPRDQPKVADGLADAALAIVVVDLVPEETYDELVGPFAALAG